MVFQGRCCYDYVIHVKHHEIPVLLGHSGQSLSHQSLKSGRCIAQAEGHPLPLVQSQFARDSGFLSILLPQRDLPEGRTQVQCGEELGITKLREALVYSQYRGRIFYRYRVQVTKVATKPKLPPFFFAITTPQAHGDFEGSIMSYSSNIFRRSRNFSKSPSPIFPFKCSISGKTGLSDSSSYYEGRSGKFEQLDKPSSVSDFIENNL